MGLRVEVGGPMRARMDANQYVVVRGMRQTRSILEEWEGNPWPVIKSWLGGAVVIALALLAAVTVAGSLLLPDYGFHYGPPPPGGAGPPPGPPALRRAPPLPPA